MNLSRNYKDLLICFDQTISTNKPCDLNNKKNPKKKKNVVYFSLDIYTGFPTNPNTH